MNNQLLSKIIYIILGVIAIALFAQLSIDVPVSEVPITGQTFAVLLVAFLLGRNLGGITIILYLLFGGLGLPIFADGASGFEVFQKGSGGFLYGFAIAAFIVGHLADTGWGSNLLKSMLAMLIGTIVIMVMGVLQLSYLYGGLAKGLEYGCYPFLIGALIKVLAGGIVGYLLKQQMKEV